MKFSYSMRNELRFQRDVFILSNIIMIILFFISHLLVGDSIFNWFYFYLAGFGSITTICIIPIFSLWYSENFGSLKKLKKNLNLFFEVTQEEFKKEATKEN